MVGKIIDDIQGHYKDTVVCKSQMSGNCLIMEVTTRRTNYPFIAKRILDRNRDIRMVMFTGGWIEGAYTRETLRSAGYKMK